MFIQRQILRIAKNQQKKVHKKIKYKKSLQCALLAKPTSFRLVSARDMSSLDIVSVIKIIIQFSLQNHVVENVYQSAF